jgi:hypothetical protein
MLRDDRQRLRGEGLHHGVVALAGILRKQIDGLLMRADLLNALNRRLVTRH